MTNNPVGWFEIYVQESTRARAFYEAVFEVKLEKLPVPDLEMWAFPMQENKTGSPGALVRMPDFPSGGNSIIVYFSCEDCGAEEARVEPAGGKVMQAKMSIGENGFVALVTDTEGNMIGLHSNR